MIIYNKESGVIELRTENSSYVMAVVDDMLVHVSYSPAPTLSQLDREAYIEPEYEFTSPHFDSGHWNNTLMLEYSAFGDGDFRCVPLMAVQHGKDCDFSAAHLRFESAAVLPEKIPPEGMPSFDGFCDTFSVTLADDFGMKIELIYCVYEKCDLITRRAEIYNGSQSEIILEKALSASVDIPAGDYDLITFNGEWAQERIPERAALRYGVQSVGSVRGIPGHDHNPAVVLCASDADEDYGTAFGFTLVYSGNFIMEAQKHRTGVRLCAGIHPDAFRWTLQPGERFTTPELAMVCSGNGLGQMSRGFHRAIKEHLIDKPWSDMRKKRPVLINSWEAAYFDFDAEKLLSLAGSAKKAGCDLFVLDDGWFRSRDDDSTSLGDWFEDERKFPDGLDNFANRLREIGLDFGVWFEPEMICEKSELFAQHPDWAFRVPGKEPVRIRHQLSLDFSREEVREEIYSRMARLIRRCGIKYVKWDMNRPFSDVYSYSTHYGEIYHRYVLGVYQLQGRLRSEFPELLLENCSSGGARFDCGMLYYSPQIWCSDNTDAYVRVRIQYGTSFFYPPACMGSHYSIVPNHTTKRSASVEARMAAALSGTFGYELDMNSIDETELDELAKYSEWYRENGHIVREGEYYRLGEPEEMSGAWLIMTEDKRTAILFSVGETESVKNAEKYLDKNISYRQEKLCDGVVKYIAE